jgi:hypothetical protein
MEKLKRIICVLLGHSKIIETCFGYVHCARCNDLLGDTLAGYYDTKENVIVGHKCDTCNENYKKLGWKDKVLCPNPFK